MDWTKEKDRGLKRFLAVAMLLSVCVTAGCKKEDSGKKTEAEFCAKISVFNCLEGRALCDKGMVQVEEGLIMFYEYGTGRSYPLCSDAYCEHIPYSDSKNPDPVCEATMKDLKTACVHGDYVYVIQQTGIQEITVQARNLKESGYRVVARLPYCQTYSAKGDNAIIGNKAYLLLAEIDNLLDDGIVQSYTSNDLHTFLVELDLKNGEYKTLFHVEGEEKYKILQTVYTEDGIYCQCYYEDIEMNADFTDFTVNDYREAFYYVPYDGSGAKELCQELKELTAFSSEAQPMLSVSGIGELGAYYVNEEMTRVECYRYDGKKEIVFELPEGYSRLHINGISGDKMIMTLTTPETTYKTAGLNLTTGELLIRDNPDNVGYVAICDGGFWKHFRSENGSHQELWRYVDIFSKDGTKLLSIEW